MVRRTINERPVCLSSIYSCRSQAVILFIDHLPFWDASPIAGQWCGVDDRSWRFASDPKDAMFDGCFLVTERPYCARLVPCGVRWRAAGILRALMLSMRLKG